VLGGGEVSLLEMTSAYGVFANDGVRHQYTPVIRVENANGRVIEQIISYPVKVLPEQTARQMSSILSDNVARAPLYGSNSVLYFDGRDVAVKTGTTNDYRDAWIIGYTPNLVIGSWVGNNDNSSMERRVAGLIVSPMWREFMDKSLSKFPNESFVPPAPEDADLKPVLRGQWRGGNSTLVYDSSGQIVGENVSLDIHTILYWVDKNNPRGASPNRPESDPQFRNWEYAVRAWASNNGFGSGSVVFVPRTGYTPPSENQPGQPPAPVEPVPPQLPPLPEEPPPPPPESYL
jgi:membrane peptidoglycan carboxypeptidase